MENSKHVNRCEQCFLEMNNNAKVEIHPVKQTRFARKILSKVEEKKPLTACQRQYYRKLSRNKLLDLKNKQKLVKQTIFKNYNELEVSDFQVKFCTFCRKKSITVISKTKPVLEKPKVKVKKQYFNSWINAVDEQPKIKNPTKNTKKQKANKNITNKKIQQSTQIKNKDVSTPLKGTIKSENINIKVENENIPEIATAASVADREFLNSNNKINKKSKFQLSKTAHKIKDVPKIINITKKQKKIEKKKMDNLNKMIQNAGNKKSKTSKLQSFLENII